MAVSTVKKQSTGKTFYKTSTGTNRNAVLHTWMGDGIRSALALGETAMFSGLFNGSTYYGLVIKATDAVVFGILYVTNGKNGFYFRDSSSDSIATSTDFQ